MGMKRKPGEVDLALRVLATIQCHGYTNPITYDALADMYQVNWREIASIVEQLRDNGHKIATSRGGFDEYIGRQIPKGCYLATRPEEIRATADMLESTAKNILARRARLMDFGNTEPTIWEAM